MAKIVFKGVKKRFGKTEVIKDLNLVINDGEFFCFLGPSGCGKSTLLNLIAGLEPVTAGKIYFDDKLVNHLSPKERNVAMVFQNYALYPHMTVYENIAFPLKLRGLPKEKIEAEVKRVAALLGLSSLLSQKPKALSGGQRQRVALGRALVRRPSVFLLDEPLSNLDARLRVELRVELKRLHQELGTTTVYVTHDQAEAMSLAERIAVLYEGKIQQCDNPLALYERPKNLFIASFIGMFPINLIKAKVRKTQPFTIELLGHLFTVPVTRIPKEKEVTIGIRPEHVRVTSKSIKEGVLGRVILTEPTGADIWVDVDINGQHIKGKAKKELLKTGKPAFIEINPERLLVFDAEGENITRLFGSSDDGQQI